MVINIRCAVSTETARQSPSLRSKRCLPLQSAFQFGFERMGISSRDVIPRPVLRPMSRLRAIIAIVASSWGEVTGEVTKYTGVVRTERAKGEGRANRTIVPPPPDREPANRRGQRSQGCIKGALWPDVACLMHTNKLSVSCAAGCPACSLRFATSVICPAKWIPSPLALRLFVIKISAGVFCEYDESNRPNYFSRKSTSREIHAIKIKLYWIKYV